MNVGAGSHASYFAPGEYVFSVRPKPVRRALRMVDTARQVWRESLRQGMSDPTDGEWSEAFAVPFIDYARGDGLRVGPGTSHELGRRCCSPGTSPGWTATAGCGGWTPVTRSAASGPRPGPSTTGTARSAPPGRT